VPGNNVTATVTVENVGTDPVNATVDNPLAVNFYLVQNSKEVKNLKAIDPSVKITHSIPPGGVLTRSMTVQLYSDTPTGTYELKACADGAKTFAEANENNNCSATAGSITVNDVSNLVVNTIQGPPAKAALGDSFSNTIQVKNLGPAPTTQATRTKYRLVLVTSQTPPPTADLTGPTTANVPVLQAGSTFAEIETLRIKTSTPVGQYLLQACADGDGNEVEGNEADNCKTSTGKINVEGLPDYVVTVSTVRNVPLEVKRGGAVIVTATVRNQGIGDALKDSILKFFLVSTTSGGPTTNLNGTRTIGKLNVGASTSVSNFTTTVNGDTPFGTYTVKACADATDVLLESATGADGTSEQNNCLMANGTVTVIP
jgi:hypothetical protein